MEALILSLPGKVLLATNEGVRTNKHGLLIPYNDSEGHATKGIGKLLHRGELTTRDLVDHPPQTVAEAWRDLSDELKEFERIVNQRCINYDLTLSQKQFDALVNVTFNSPRGALIIMKAMRDNVGGAEFADIFITKSFGASLVSSPGLISRRKSEYDLYMERGAYLVASTFTNDLPEAGFA